MSNIVTLESFPFDSMEILNEESGKMEDDRLYTAKVFREYFAMLVSNGVYFGHYKNLGENSMKVTLDNGLTIKVHKGCGVINGANYKIENNTLFVLERPANGERKDRVVVRIDDTLSVRETQLYIKEGKGTTPAELQRDENIYEICIAEVTVKSTSNLTEADIVDTRLNKELCGIVNSLISVDGEELYQKFQEYIDTVAENLVRKDKDNVIQGKIIVNGGIESNKEIIANKGIKGICTQVQTTSIIGEIQIVNGRGHADINYPNGYNRNNVCIGTLFAFPQNSENKSFGYLNGYLIGGTLFDTYIRIEFENYLGTLQSGTYKFEIVLMRKD